MSDDDVESPHLPHIRISLTWSIITSAIIGLCSWSISWGKYSTELVVLQQSNEKLQTTVQVMQTQIAVNDQRYSEILRRIDELRSEWVNMRKVK